ncbi:binding-protein-dependent transport systems inner membrane component [Haladaptatus paucihalophilus DX253]|uniref:Binding-protein-dependent transport systems inner membrane component n=1 Tax=Haladaptatus paucihalophilus DX253 TaxID=797209 RepID=E7QZM2_HALPU|nr:MULTISPECIES: carbohydrate ABC transporter permease [Haladaptatus]EFW90143.1 binding-protein-dependent transport systems inner membrane component [Haladaptatus paucihalophilus DX253]ODR79182.1 ABC transporter permease [Haladaptatus sp. W1]GKZ14574.1 sugar ABC transporter permease [Haladaptatus sp. T7]SHL06850.1 multiple sugar transport system permease protein [Haladaptatus paucihalophilus DX253]
MSNTDTTVDESQAEYFDSERLYRIGLYVVMYGLAALFFIPYWRMFQLSVTPMKFISQGGFHLVPPEITFAIWKRYLIEEPIIYQWAFNTLLISSITTFIVLVVDSMIAYSITRLEWPGRSIVLGVIMASFMIPGYVNIIPLYTLINDLGLINSYWAIILPFAAGPLGVFLLVQFFRDIPKELEEAARLDGFSSVRIYTHMILPLSTPILTALGLFVFIWSWNQFLWPLIVLNDDALFTLPIGVVTLRSVNALSPNLIMTSLALASMPLFIVFLLFQDKLISSVQMQAGTG